VSVVADCSGHFWLSVLPVQIGQRTKGNAEICALLGYYAEYSDNSVRTFRDNLSVPSSKVKNSGLLYPLKDGTDRLSRNVGNFLTLEDWTDSCPETSVTSSPLKMGPIGYPETSVTS
jgi:hypothetical protein